MVRILEIYSQQASSHALSLVLISQNCFGYLGSFWFYTNFMIYFSISLKNTVGLLVGFTLKLYTTSGGMNVLIVCTFPVMKIGCISIFVCLLHFLSLLFCSFQCTDLSPPWLRLFLNIFFFFGAIVNGVLNVCFR